MSQEYKAIYFPDIPADTSKQKSLTIAFGKRTYRLYEVVKDMSSAEIRQLLGTESYQDIVDSAQAEDLPVNTYCLRRLKQSVRTLRERRGQLSLQGIDMGERLFDPVIVTFRGGAKEPFRRWYPYLEGYSPKFVETILQKYAPNAQRVLDPFAGTGTTAFTASHLGKMAYFCEVNPVLQFITLTKIRVRRLDISHRLTLAQDLMETIRTPLSLVNFKADYALRQSYQRTFRDSVFFDEPVYEQTLRLRSWIDEIALTKPLLADVVTIAVLSALVPASRLKRAGDLRYKRSNELENQMVPLIEAVRGNIEQMARDIRDDVNGLQTEPLLVCENAGSLAYIPYLNIDAVVTSPPYVNGTNYFRNTKIELWFLRCLREKKDLTRFRASALTAGINDVTVSRTPAQVHPDVEAAASALEESAYDPRIPRMIRCYFSEITDIFRAVSMHLAPGAKIAIDIGDSCYAGVHVPSDHLLSTCLQDLGFEQEDSTVLRRRRSRGGELLSQVLLTFKFCPQTPSFQVTRIIQPWSAQWDAFKNSLPHQQVPYSKRNWGHPRHSLCSYPGKLKPAIAYHLIRTFVPEQGTVLDPFAGVGTLPFEAALQGKKAYGFDLSPAAFIIASAKMQRPTEKGCAKIINDLKEFIENNIPTKEELLGASKFGFNGKIAEYYESQTLAEVVLARRYFRISPPETPEAFFVLASLLHILHGNRPYALSRRSHPITPYKPSGPYKYRSLIDRVTAKVQRSISAALPEGFQSGKMFLQDAVGWWPREIESLDAIITSPPFFDSTRYYLANWLRLWFSGWSQHDFDVRPLGFVDERQKESFDVYISILRQARERLKSSGVVVLHLGKSAKCDMASELEKLGKKWFRSVDIFDESVTHCESHGIRDKGTVTSHQYLLLY